MSQHISLGHKHYFSKEPQRLFISPFLMFNMPLIKSGGYADSYISDLFSDRFLPYLGFQIGYLF